LKTLRSQAEGLLYCGSAAPVEQAFGLHWPILSQRAIVTGLRLRFSGEDRTTTA